jgi:3-hydroxyacyl-CoA dehydrogenase
MALEIKQAAVIGAGWMGTSIAALIASAGIDTLLLDVLPPMEPGEEERKAGVTRFTESWRSSLASNALKLAASREAFLDPAAIAKVKPGNVVDNLDWLASVDWVIEVVPEVLGAKRATYERIMTHVRPDAVITSNTSGILVSQLVEGLPEAFRRQFFVSHFFNPVRLTSLCELVPGEDTDRKLVERFSRFVADRLGKGVIVSRDTPYFIANRLGLFSILTAMAHAEALGLAVGECDRLTGFAMARPGSGTFRTADIVGLDSMLQVFDNLHGSLAGDPCRDRFNAPAFFRLMIEKGLWGDKTGKGFYRRRSLDGQWLVECIDYETLEYKPEHERSFESLNLAESIHEPAARLKALVFGSDLGSRFAWACVRDMLAYAGHLLGRIVDNPLTIDRAMRWGYNWELGPFEVWDCLGVAEVTARMETDGTPVPDSVRTLLNSGRSKWYAEEDNRRKQFSIESGAMIEAPHPRGVLSLDEWSVMEQVGGLKLYDLGDGIGCLSIAPPHSEGLRVDIGFNEAMDEILDTVTGGTLAGLVVTSEATDFSTGLNMTELLRLCDAGLYDEIERRVRKRQILNQRLKTVGVPVVAVLAGRTFGSGYELAMHCSRLQVHAEVQISMNEVLYGLIPSAGGCKEMLFRAVEKVRVDGPHPIVQRAFDMIMAATLARGAFTARALGLLRKGDNFSMGRKNLLSDAKAELRHMLEHGFSPPPRPPLSLPGAGGRAYIEHQLELSRLRGEISDEAVVVGRKLAYVLCGGDCTPVGRVTEDMLLDLEREAYLSLCGMEQTRRMLRRGLSSRYHGEG